MKAVRIHRQGGPEVLVVDDVELAEPTGTEVRVRVAAAGVNFVDIYHRSGLYPVRLPQTLGREGAGVIEAVGAEVLDFAPGDRVAWAQAPNSYAELAIVASSKIVRVPDDVSSEAAAAVMLQGATAHYLAHSTRPLEKGDTCLVYAAAGGVGLLLTQIAKLRGAIVIGTVSTEEKAELARAAGADHVIRYDEHDVAGEVRRITEGRGADVAYDGVGRDTWTASLESLRPRGMLVSYGNASGPVGAIDPLELRRHGSLFLTRPSLADYIATRDELEWRAGDLFRWIASGQITIHIDRRLPLARAGDAHRALEARQTIGKVLLIP